MSDLARATAITHLVVIGGDARLRYYFPFNDSRDLRAYESSKGLSREVWHSVAVVFDDQAKQLQFWIDGTLDRTVSTASLGDIKTQVPWSGGGTIGAGGQFSTSGALLNGLVDDVMFHDRALSAAEVAFLASGGGRDDVPPPGKERSGGEWKVVPCGRVGQDACAKCTSYFWWPPTAWGQCQEWEYYCIAPAHLDELAHNCFAIQVQPTFTVKPLSTFTNLLGFQAKIANAPQAQYSTIDSRGLGMNCDRLETWARTQCASSGSESCKRVSGLLLGCEGTRPRCSAAQITDNNGVALNFPLYTLAEWQAIHPTRLKINANWFDINGPSGFPYLSPCTDIFGYSVASGMVVSPADNPDVVGEKKSYLDAFVVITEIGADGSRHTTLRIVPNKEISSLRNVTTAVGGFILVKDGKNVDPGSSVKAPLTGARTALGLSKDGQTLTIMVVQPGPGKAGMTVNELTL